MPSSLPYAWHCLQCDANGSGDGSDLAARKHEKATSHGTTTHLARSGWCTAPEGMRPKHEACRVAGCACVCHGEAA